MFFRIILIILLAPTYIVPFILVMALTVILRKLSFSARIHGPFTFTDVMLKYDVKMNFSIIVRVEKISLKL